MNLVKEGKVMDGKKTQKTKVTRLEPFILENCNYSWEICFKCLNYDYLNYSFYEQKTE